MKILDGKDLQKNFFKEIKHMVSVLQIRPKLFVISIDKQLEKQVYLRQIQKMCKEVGYDLEVVFFEGITEGKLLQLIQEKNQDPEITGILILAPFPFYLNEDKIYDAILPTKDVEALGSVSQSAIYGNNSSYYPCTVSSIISLLKFHNIDVKGKNVVIFNRSKRIGKPLWSYFLSQDCTVTMMHRQSVWNSEILKQADIVVSAVGKGTFLEGNLFKKGSTVIDLGMFSKDGKIVGDVFLENHSCIENYISHTGGVGPMTVACLAQNILSCYYRLMKDK